MCMYILSRYFVELLLNMNEKYLSNFYKYRLFCGYLNTYVHILLIFSRMCSLLLFHVIFHEKLLIKIIYFILHLYSHKLQSVCNLSDKSGLKIFYSYNNYI